MRYVLPAVIALFALLLIGGPSAAVYATPRVHTRPAISTNGPLIIEDSPLHPKNAALRNTLRAVQIGGAARTLGPADLNSTGYLTGVAASPHGHYLAVGEQLGGLWIVSSNGTITPRRIIGGNSRIGPAVDVTTVAWSPDGLTLAYIRDTRNMGCGCGPNTPDTTPGDGLWTVQYNASQTAHLVLSSASMGTNMVNRLTGWTPDGRGVVVDTARGIEEIDISTRARRLLAAGVVGSLSPDGVTLAIHSTSGSRTAPISTLAVRSLSNGTTRVLAHTQSLVGSPVWSPDGRSIAYDWFPAGSFSGNTVGEVFEVHMIDVASGAVSVVFKDPQSDGTESHVEAWLPAAR